VNETRTGSELFCSDHAYPLVYGCRFGAGPEGRTVCPTSRSFLEVQDMGRDLGRDLGRDMDQDLGQDLGILARAM
jgi:hypothetical protein